MWIIQFAGHVLLKVLDNKKQNSSYEALQKCGVFLLLPRRHGEARNKKYLIELCNWAQNESLTKHKKMAQIQHTNSALAKHSTQWLRPIGTMNCNVEGSSMSFSAENDYPNIGPFYNKLS